MFKGRGVLLNPLYWRLKSSINHSASFQKSKSTKSAIHAALSQREHEFDKHSSRSWGTREKGNFAQGTARDQQPRNKTRPVGDREWKDSRQAKFPRDNRHWGAASPPGRRNRPFHNEELEREHGGRDNTPRNAASFSSQRRNGNFRDDESRSSGAAIYSRERPRNEHRQRNMPNPQPDDDVPDRLEHEATFGHAPRNESSSRMEGWQQQDPTPLTLPYTTSASEFLYGQGVVTAALRAKRREFYKLYMSHQSRGRAYNTRDKEMEAMAHKAGVPVEKIGAERYRMLDKMSEGRPHNGFVLEASPLPKLPVTGFDRLDRPGQQFLAFLGRQSLEDERINGTDPRIKYNGAGAFPRYPFVLLLDGVLDPQNLGAIMRSAFFFGVDAIALTTNRTAPLSPAALKASAGASEALPIFTVDQTRDFLMECKKNGWKVYASQADPARYSKSREHGLRHLTTSTLVSDVNRRPCILIIGSEGQGLYKDVEGAADNTVSIEGPRQGELGIDSLNVSVATALLCQSFLRDPSEGQRKSTNPPKVSEEEYRALDIQNRLF